MAEHSLRIQAHLDVNELNSELDRLNQQRGGEGANDTTGNGISLGMRLRQLQTSLDNLNTTLKNMVKQSNVESNRASATHVGGGDPSLPGILGARDAAKMRAARLEAVRWNAKLTEQIRERMGISDEEWRNMPFVQRMRIRRDPTNADIWGQRRDASPNTSQEQTKNEFRLQRRNMGLAIGGHFASMIGSSLQEAGYQRAGGAFNVIGGSAGGAASGAVFGPYGVLIGAAVGTITSVASELKKLGAAAEEATKKFQKMTQDAIAQVANFRQNEDIKWASDKTQNDWASWDDLQRNKVFAEGRADFLRRMLEGTSDEYGLREKLQFYENELENGENDSRKAGAAIEVAKLIPQIQRVEGWLEQWESIAKENQKKMDAIDPYSNENHEKFVEEMLRQAEMERENEERRKQLLQEREQILLGIEQEYAQQGVDILSGMGKSGKYMSQAEAASTSQERYAPITKKLDTMQKSLDHLSQIDAKLRNLNIGLT